MSPIPMLFEFMTNRPALALPGVYIRQDGLKSWVQFPGERRQLAGVLMQLIGGGCELSHQAQTYWAVHIPNSIPT